MTYSEKVPLNQALKKEPNANVPDELKDKEELQEKPSVADTQEEADALRIPPDPTIPTGILSVIIHQINNCTSFTSLLYVALNTHSSHQKWNDKISKATLDHAKGKEDKTPPSPLKKGRTCPIPTARSLSTTI